MTTPNPFKAPKASIDKPTQGDKSINTLLRGRQFMVYSLLLYIALMLLAAIFDERIQFLIVIPFIMSIVGVVIVCQKLSFPVLWTIGSVLAMCIPVINVVAILLLNRNAQAELRKSGHHVGLFGSAE